MVFSESGFEVCRGIVSDERINSVKDGIIEIMKPYCTPNSNNVYDIDDCFRQISESSPELKKNCYKLFGRLAALPLLLSDPGIAKRVADLGFSKSTIQAFSVFCLEPGNAKNTFLPHQDLRERTSLRSLLIWTPLSSGERIGGMGCYEGTHHDGPLRHDITDTGKPFVDEQLLKYSKYVDLTDFQVGDCVFMDPYLIHQSEINEGDQIRWTAVIKIDSIENLSHLENGIHPFPIDEYIDLRQNEERLKLA